MEKLEWEGIVTGTTCGLACWWAEQEACRCSCGGRAHGVLALGGTQPRRNCLIAGHRYVLGAVNGGWSRVNQWAAELVRREYADVPMGYRPSWRSDPGAIWIQRQATPTQWQRWPELVGYEKRPQLEWIRADWADAFDAWLREN